MSRAIAAWSPPKEAGQHLRAVGSPRSFDQLLDVVVDGGRADYEPLADLFDAQSVQQKAGDFAFALFSIGIIATGLLAVPVLASSAAYAVAEAFGWPEGLERHWREAKGFYAIIGIATIVGTGLDLTSMDPMKALYWSAVVNGVVAVPIMVAMMILSGNAAVMGALPVKRKTRFFGWGAVAVMFAAVVMMVWDLFR